MNSYSAIKFTKPLWTILKKITYLGFRRKSSAAVSSRFTYDIWWTAGEQNAKVSSADEEENLKMKKQDWK